jgi:hypothetical protein
MIFGIDGVVFMGGVLLIVCLLGMALLRDEVLP